MVVSEIAREDEINRQPPETLEPLRLKSAALKTKTAKRVTAGGIEVDTVPTGRTPAAKGIVESSMTSGAVDWGKVNKPVTQEEFEALAEKQRTIIERSPGAYKNTYFVQLEERAISVNLVTTSAWSALFASNLFLTNDQRERGNLEIDRGYSVEIIHTPSRNVDTPAVWTDFKPNGRTTISINGTEYAGEIKKSAFNAVNFIAPNEGDLSLHCAADADHNGDTVLYLGMSGTGKTTLSTNPDRLLVGDDEHVWSEYGLNNIEGGCYAKLISLSAEREPEIYRAVFDELAVLENVELDEKGSPVFSSGEENMRGAYSLDALKKNRVYPNRIAGHPKNIIFLTADALGGMPMVAKLTPEQAIYQFLAGYTSKIPGTEAGVIEPEAMFSSCFGEPFLPRDALIYANLFSEKVRKYGANVYLVNTGWQGGYRPQGRTPLEYSRACVSAIQKGILDDVPVGKDGLGFYIPRYVPGVPEEMLNPANAFVSREDYAHATRRLEEEFLINFKKKFWGRLQPGVVWAAPMAQVGSI